MFKLKQHEYFEHFESYALSGLDLLLPEDLPVFVTFLFFLERLRSGTGCSQVSVLGDLVAASRPCVLFEVAEGS